MKKLTLKKVTTALFTLFITLIISTSCSSEDEKDPIVEFTSLNATKTEAFIEEAIILNLEGTGFTEVNLVSSNTSVKIIKVSSTIYQISSSAATNTTIYATLSNKTYKANKNISLNFYEHGVKNFKTVEGITVDTDKSAKVITLLGEPDAKITSTDGLSEYWNYHAKGLSFIIIKSSTIVNQADLYSSYYYFTNSANIKISFINYPYEIGNGWKINNTTTMDAVITQLGTPSLKNNNDVNILYQYSAQRIAFRFYSDSQDNYTGKKINYFSVY
jgi:hypothetical protein